VRHTSVKQQTYPAQSASLRQILIAIAAHIAPNSTPRGRSPLRNLPKSILRSCLISSLADDTQTASSSRNCDGFLAHFGINWMPMDLEDQHGSA
jgi:hypothetical protein